MQKTKVVEWALWIGSIGSVLGAAAAAAAEVSAAPGPWNRVSLGVTSLYHGTSLTSMGSSTRAVGVDGRVGRELVNLDTRVTAAYGVTPDLKVGVEVPFYIYPVEGGGVSLGDAGLKASYNLPKLAPGLTLNAALNLQAPTSAYTQATGMVLGVKATPSVRYEIPGTRFAVGMFTEEKAYLGVKTGKLFKLWGAPYVNYALSPTLALSLMYEAEYKHYSGDAGVFQFTNAGADVEPGVVWQITPSVLLNPFFQVFTNGPITIERSAIGAYFAAKLI